jgi:pyruvate dehydrogenase E2 component (dihydrolipoamide acetyltransferase)
MSTSNDIQVPDIGDFTDVPVIEVFVKVGDTVKAEDPLVSLESDKATMDVPAPRGGKVKSIAVKVGDKVSQGSVIMAFEGESAAAAAAPAVAAKPSVSAPPSPVNAPAGLAEVRVPDIGDFKDVPVIEIFVKVGDTVKAEDPLVSLESDKATMDVPAPLSGVVQAINIAVGDKVSEGSVILVLATGDASAATAAASATAGTSAAMSATAAAPVAAAAATTAASGSGIDEAAFALAYAGPAVRKLAREMSVNLGLVKGTGAHGRIVRDDVLAFAKGGAAAPAAAAGKPAAAATAGGAGLDLLPWPKVDFAKFGPIERKELSRIKKISAANLHRNWVVIPHVTTHDEADITDLEAFRVQMNKELEKSGVKISMLPFMMKAAVAALKKFPEFNGSLESTSSGDALVLKNYWHIGFAADTPNGLMVPVIRDVDKKTVPDIAREMGELAKLARDGKLKPDQMQGGTFTISSLGGIGGIYFTPIINAPEVSIMGVCKSYWKQVSSDGKQYQSRLILPLSLSWDHRVIDGAAAARFNVHFASVLADLRRVLF